MGLYEVSTTARWQRLFRVAADSPEEAEAAALGGRLRPAWEGAQGPETVDYVYAPDPGDRGLLRGYRAPRRRAGERGHAAELAAALARERAEAEAKAARLREKHMLRMRAWRARKAAEKAAGDAPLLSVQQGADCRCEKDPTGSAPPLEPA